MRRQYSEVSPFRRSWNNYGGVSQRTSFDTALPVANQLSLNLAGIYLYLAVYPHSKLFTKITTLHQARSYRDYYSYTSQFMLWMAILLLMFLTFVEDGEWMWDPSVSFGVEFVCLGVLFCKILHKRYFMGHEQFMKNPSAMLHLGLLVVLAADFVLAVSEFQMLKRAVYFRYLRALRPVLMFDHASSVRMRFIDMMVAGYRARTMFLLMSFNLVFFSVVGTILFYQTSEGKEYFPDFSTSLITLIVLQTGSNHPMVIVKAFTEFSRWSELYFVLFLLMSYFLMLNLMLGVIYHELTARLRDAAAQELLDSAAAMRISMFILASCETGEGENSIRSSGDGSSGSTNVDYDLTTYMIASEFSLSLPHVRRLLNRCRLRNDRDGFEFGITRQVFARIPAMLRLQQSIEEEGEEEEEEDEEKDGSEGDEEKRGYFSIITAHLRRLFSKRLSKTSDLTYVDAFVVSSLLLLLGLMVSAMVVDLPSYFQDSPTWFDVIGQALTICFAIELLLKLLAFGLFRFTDDMWNMFDTACIMCSAMGAFVVTDPKSQQIMAGARLMRLLRVVPGFRNLTGAAAAFAPAVGPSICAILCIFYSVALCMVGLLGKYRLEEYNANDFRDFVAALVTLFELAVVNDWNVTMAGFVVATGTKWVEVFFVSWWALSQLILFNSVTSLVLDGFEVRMRELAAVHEPSKTPPASANGLELLHRISSSSSRPNSRHSKRVSYGDEDEEHEAAAAVAAAVGDREEEGSRLLRTKPLSRTMPPPFVKSSSFTVGRMFVELFRNVNEPTDDEVDAACAKHGFRF
ncbi:hypothetical protein BASA81_001351 [Batrachochytrium salamandrivorans]|nr:hypothetical protein BASA81_001351 [Batrachochytrium salamandrivorans]